MHEVLQSLQQLHNEGLVHKDVKLENVMIKEPASPTSPGRGRRMQNKTLTGPAEFKLADFDFTDVDSPASTVVGTDGYIAPEAYLGKVGAKSDVYSAGVIMYTLLAKKFPYSRAIFDDKPGENYVGSPKMKEIHDRMQSFKVHWIEPIWGKLPKAKAFCQHLLAFDSALRFTTDQALADPWIADFFGRPGEEPRSQPKTGSMRVAPPSPESARISSVSGFSTAAAVSPRGCVCLPFLRKK